MLLWFLVPGSGFPVGVPGPGTEPNQVPGTGNQELVDRTLALVGGQPITLSDARAALALGLIDIAPGSTTPMGNGITLLIQRELILREVQRYAPAAPSDSAVEERLERIRGRFRTRQR